MSFKKMKGFKILIGLSAVLPSALISCTNSAMPEKKNRPNSMIKHGENGRHGKNGQSGENGEDGCNGGNGGNGGNSDWGRGGDGGNGGDESTNATLEQTQGQVDEWEYKILKDICRQIIDNTVSQICGTSSTFDKDNLLEATCKQNISAYLLQMETPASKKLWEEYENTGWRYPAIISI